MAAAFNCSIASDLHNTIRSLFYRRQRIGSLLLSFDEYIRTFVPPDARELFQQVARHTAAPHWNRRWELHMPSGYKVDATLKLYDAGDFAGGAYAPPMPREIRIQGDAPLEVVNRIYEWAERGGDVSREFGRVSSVFERLNVSLSRVAIRYYWPTILALLSESGKSANLDLVRELQDLKQPARLKPLPPGLSTACRLTAETIATTRLLPADVMEPDPSGSAELGIVTGQTYTEQFNTFCGIQ
jgi:hypothetical protein